MEKTLIQDSRVEAPIQDFKVETPVQDSQVEASAQDPRLERALAIKTIFDQIKDELMGHTGNGPDERRSAQILLNSMNDYLQTIPHGSGWDREEIKIDWPYNEEIPDRSE